jgi:membrane protein YdbS with pleckstrin-like domain
MSEHKRKILSLREAFWDTGLALLINTPLNFAFIAFAFHIELSALATSLWLTFIFTVLAIVRKYWLRMRFYKKYG